MKCKSCGVELSENSKFCGICGAANTFEEDNGDSVSVEEVKEEIPAVDNILEDRKDEIDDILSKYDNKSEESVTAAYEDAQSAVHTSEAAGREDLGGDIAKSEQQDDRPQQQEEIAQRNNYQAGANPQYGGNNNPNMPYNGYPQNNQNPYYTPYGGGYPQNPAFIPPYPQGYPQNNPMPNQNNTDTQGKGTKTKEKRVVSLGVAVFCIIMVLILSAICGYLTEICLGSGINPLNPSKTYSIVQLDGNTISEGSQNG